MADAKTKQQFRFKASAGATNVAWSSWHDRYDEDGSDSCQFVSDLDYQFRNVPVVTFKAGYYREVGREVHPDLEPPVRFCANEDVAKLVFGAAQIERVNVTKADDND